MFVEPVGAWSLTHAAMKLGHEWGTLKKQEGPARSGQTFGERLDGVNEGGVASMAVRFGRRMVTGSKTSTLLLASPVSRWCRLNCGF